MNTINYDAQAALYLGSDLNAAFAQGARRFSSAAKAIRFALEEAAPVSLRGARMIVDGRTYDARDLHDLYDKDGYPLLRKQDRQAILQAE